mmetsp:Transcript_24467/g.68034  ORF Transcript_24467/g.68034 Transcript_24467/m.68034 type:complete len:241 (+) Transcript_24467:459-1181(+)|eukprot:CAMPEP_0117658114 /NCGR_PEP_ID=MMETSP0804-20121206/5691_1 /TAXON_ID=1074897 /ORGANISM="Tetraselmis astigmatica, Strain CCMP880" /LENGTH=240 /DNA_ID=CAMNT_0005464613 /DNA_START=402 /DNA_END=1124 /DNA_ORIENTATION=+
MYAVLQIVPKCPHCKKEEDVPFKDVPAARKRFWIWHEDLQLFLCTKCTAQRKIETRQKEQMVAWYKSKESTRNDGMEDRQMRRLWSGKKWERTQSFKQSYSEPTHVASAVEKAMSAHKNGGAGLVRANSGFPSKSASWAEDLHEEDLVHRPSQAKEDRHGTIEGFELHDISDIVIEEGDEAELSRSTHQVENGETEPAPSARQGVNGSDVHWGDLNGSGLIDVSVTEVSCPAAPQSSGTD